VLGNQGLFGSDLEHTLLSTGEHAVGFNRSNLDLQQPVSEIASCIRTNGQFDILVNAIAYTAVDKGEKIAI
jgi:dTDP-4-dehydrorhamnose reductase